MTNLKTKLTKERRTHIIDSVYAATLIPAQKISLVEVASKKAREILRSRLPKGFEAAIATLPPEWFSKLSSVNLRKDVNPETLMKPDETYNTYYMWASLSFIGFSQPEFMSHRDYGIEQYRKSSGREDTDDCWEVHLAKEIAEAKKIKAKEDELRGKLRDVLNSVTTYGALLEKMPELEKHLPAGPTKYYPVAVSVTPLVKLLDSVGFDQSVTT